MICICRRQYRKKTYEIIMKKISTTTTTTTTNTRTQHNNPFTYDANLKCGGTQKNNADFTIEWHSEHEIGTHTQQTQSDRK